MWTIFNIINSVNDQVTCLEATPQQVNGGFILVLCSSTLWYYVSTAEVLKYNIYFCW